MTMIPTILMMMTMKLLSKKKNWRKQKNKEAETNIVFDVV